MPSTPGKATSIGSRILDIWARSIWTASYPTLIHHLLHITGGTAVVFLLLVFGVDRLLAHILSTLLFLIVESITTIIRNNFADSLFDWVQYQAHWIVFLLAVGYPLAAVGALVLFLTIYFILLVAD